MSTADTPSPGETAKTSKSGSTRLPSLDGLRGVAALIVVFWHALISTGLQPILREDPWDAETFSTKWWLYDTPLRILTMGNQAVAVFFVLSGLVLVLPLLRGKPLNPFDYYPRRLSRLWIPMAVAALLGALLYWISAARPDAKSGWVNLYSTRDLTLDLVLADLFPPLSGTYLNNPSWSLTWEILFSLLLPMFFVLALAARQFLWTSIIGLTVLVGVGAQFHSPVLKYLPFFVIGGLTARIMLERKAPSQWAAGLMSLCGILLISFGDFTRIVTGSGYTSEQNAWSFAGNGLGSALLILGAVFFLPLTRTLSWAPVAWLGKISYSLYLVHVPIILAALHLMGTDEPGQALLVSVPLSFLAAMLFHRVIEKPSISWAASIGKASARLASSLPALATADKPGKRARRPESENSRA